ADGSPEEEYLRRILQLSREKAKARGGEGGAEPASFLESGGSEGDMEESLWKLAEPFDRMLERRKRRLEQMDALIGRARGRIKGLESSTNPLEIRERDELKRQIEELLLEKEDILKLEEGLVNMENTYRNILRLQQDELKARETSLRGRIDAFRRELESREKAFGQLKERESDIVRKEDEFRSVMNRVHERQRELEKREELLRDKGRLLDERHHALSGGEVDLERKRWELEQKASGGRPATKEESTRRRRNSKHPSCRRSISARSRPRRRPGRTSFGVNWRTAANSPTRRARRSPDRMRSSRSSRLGWKSLRPRVPPLLEMPLETSNRSRSNSKRPKRRSSPSESPSRPRRTPKQRRHN